MPIRKPWRFFDPIDSEEYVLPVNANEGGSPSFKKNITYQNTSAPDGTTLIFEGRDEVQSLSFAGVILEKDQYDAFVKWYKKRHQIRITDDLDREFWVYITEFTPTRQRAVSRPWKHTYTCSATILDKP